MIIKNGSVKAVYNILLRKMCQMNIKICLTINVCQSVKYEKGEIKFLNYGNQIPIVCKIYADSECSFKKVEIWEGEYTRKYQEDIPNSFCAKLVCIDDRFNLPEVIFSGKNSCNDFIK